MTAKTKQAVILAGGQGTRLGELTRHTPKPLLPINGRPFLDYLLWNLSRHGFGEIILSCGYLGEQFAGYASAHRWNNTTVHCIIEPEPLGTGGALRYLSPHLQDHFLLLNGDSLFDINYLDLTLPVESAPPASATVALRAVDNASRYGRVATEGGRITHFLEKDPDPQPGLINGGICWMERSLLERLPEGNSSLERELFPQLVTEGRLFGKAYAGYFIDIGIPDDYQRAEREVAAWQRRPALFFDRDGVLNEDSGYVHRPEQFAWMEGAPQAIRWCNEQGYLVLVVTNQAGIARGYYTEAEFHTLTDWMQEELAGYGAHLDATYHCPHHPTAGNGTLRTACHCRKPNPGMLEQAMEEWEIDRGKSLLIGDKPSDLEAAQRAGVAGHLFSGGRLDLFLENLLHNHKA
ncbi:MAG: D-glycero-beta-D-manno-heptose 1,7-bisphosphate 7-phosphatase [Magnetococcus sp. YQC-3]